MPLAYELVDNCIILVVDKKDPSIVEWDQYLAFVTGCFKKIDGPVRTLVLSRGGGPSAVQRDALNKTCEPIAATARVAVCTDSTITRGIATALGWFVTGYKAFSPKDLDQALTFLRLTPATAAQVKVAAHGMETKLGLR